MPYRYDLFFSYARRDDENGWISAFHRELDRTTRAHGTLGDHNIFFDAHEIDSGDDWEQRILAGLRDSCLILAFVSPNYLASEWCRKEWEFYVRHEHARRVEAQGVHPIYFIDAPGFDGPDPAADEWLEDLRSRQRVDLRAWHNEGTNAFRHTELRQRIAEFEHQLYNIQRRMRAAAAGEGTAFKSRSTHFVGRRRELQHLSRLLAGGTFGVLTAVHGWPGVGKTALAAEYAHSHAAKYTAGSWLLRCSGKDRLVLALEDLLTDFPIDFTDAEQKDPDRKVRRIFVELEKRIVPTKEDPYPACLLIFDNVDRSALLDAAEMAQVPPRSWLHLLVTTRLGPSDLPGIQNEHFLAVDEMEEADALGLIESLQRGGRFASDDERDAARWIVHAVRRLALEVEGVAVYLGADPDLTCRESQQRLVTKGLAAAEEAGEAAGGQMLHRGRRLSVVFGELLAALNEREQYVLDCAALLPPDYVALPWLEALARTRFPGWDEWKKTVRKLMGRRLLSVAESTGWDGKEPLARMHRAVQETVVRRIAFPHRELLIRISVHAAARADSLRTGRGWTRFENRWEIAPLAALAERLFDVRPVDASVIADHAATLYQELGDYDQAESLFRRVLEVRARTLGEAHQSTLASLNNLGEFYRIKGNHAQAGSCLRSALDAQSRTLGKEHPNTLASMNNLALLLIGERDYDQAEPLCRGVLNARESLLGEGHIDVIASINNLAGLFQARGDYAAADSLFRRALEANERTLGHKDPNTLTSVNNLAVLCQERGDHDQAISLFRRALEARQRVLGADHPDTIVSCYKLAESLAIKGDFEEAEPLVRRALDSFAVRLGADHPTTRMVATKHFDLLVLLRRRAEAKNATP